MREAALEVSHGCLHVHRLGATSTCVKSSGLVESRLDVAFPLGLDARWQYNWKSIRSTTFVGSCVSMQVRRKVTQK